MRRWEYRHSVLAICSVVFALYHATRQIMPPVLPVMKDEFGLSYAQAGFLASTYDLGYGLTLILGGLAADRLRKVPLILAGLILLFLSLVLTPHAGSFEAITAARILGGMALGAYFATGVSLVSSYFPKERRGMALGIHAGMGAGSGKFFAPLLAGLLLTSLGWRPLYYFVGIPVLLTAVLFWRTVKEPEDKELKVAPSARSTIKEVFGSRFLATLGLCNMLVIGVSITLYSFLPLYMVNEMGVSVSDGGYAVALLNGVSVPFVPLVGTISDRIGRKPVIFGFSVLTALALYVFPMLPNGPVIWLGIVVLGLFSAAAFPIIITYAADGSPPHYRSVALGYVNTFSIVGNVAAAVIAGYISDGFGVRQVFLFVAALSAIAAVASLLVEPKMSTLTVAQEG